MFRFAAAVAASLLLAAPAAALAFRLDSLTLWEPWVAASYGSARTSAAYLTVQNFGRTEDHLVSASCSCAESVEVHHMWTDNGIMRMRPAEGGLAVPAGGKVALSPAGDHMMLMGLKAPLKDGMRVKLTLVFQHNGRITMDVPVKTARPAAMGGMRP